MGFLQDFVADVRLPPLHRVRQHFDDGRVEDLPGAVAAQLRAVLSPSDVAGQSVECRPDQLKRVPVGAALRTRGRGSCLHRHGADGADSLVDEPFAAQQMILQ